MRLLKANGGTLSQLSSGTGVTDLAALFGPGLVGMVMSFATGLLALKWLSNWLERGRWRAFGYYCLGASLVIFILHRAGLI